MAFLAIGKNIYIKVLSLFRGNAADLAARFAIDIRARKSWQDSLAVIEQKVNRYCAL